MSKVSRRTFLISTTGLLTLPLIAKPASALTLGFSLYGMKTLKTEPALKQIAAIGYDSVELCLNKGWDAAPSNMDDGRRKETARLLNHLDLRITALMENLKLNGAQAENHERLKQAAQLGHDLSSDKPPIIETVIGNGKWEDVKNEFRDHLGGWVEVAAKSKTIICVKPHRFGAANLPQHGKWLMEQIKSPWIRLAYDYSHFIHRDITLEASIKTMIPWTRFIHVKDTILKKGRARFVLPGESGQIDYARLLRLAHASGYKGDINVEVSGQVWNQKGYDPIAAAKKSYTHMAAAFDKARINK